MLEMHHNIFYIYKKLRGHKNIELLPYDAGY